MAGHGGGRWAAVLLTAALVASLSTSCSRGPTAARPASSAPVTTQIAGPTTSTPGQPATATPTTAVPASSQAQVRATVRARIARISAAQPRGAVSVAALNTGTGVRFASGARHGMWTASAYKVLVLVALLMRTRGALSSADVDLAARAIENSDNQAGYSLFLRAGATSGVDEALHVLGMTHTVPGRTDPTFTTTSAPDYLKLLAALTAQRGPSRPVLSSSSRAFALGLMRSVQADQRWGVGAVADPGTRFANKNGWLSIDSSNSPDEADGDRWAVSSVGVVTVRHQQLLLAVFTQHQRDFASGVALVTKLARTMAPAVT